MCRRSTRYSTNTQIQAHCVLCVPAPAHRCRRTVYCVSPHQHTDTGALCIVCPRTSTQMQAHCVLCVPAPAHRYRRTVYCVSPHQHTDTGALCIVCPRTSTQMQAHCVLCVPAPAHRYRRTVYCVSPHQHTDAGALCIVCPRTSTQMHVHCVLCVPAPAHRYRRTVYCVSPHQHTGAVYCRNIPPAQASFSSSVPFSELAHSRVSGTPPVRVRRVCCRVQNPRPHRSPRLASWRHAVSVCWFGVLTAELWAASWCFGYYEVHSTMSEEQQRHNHKRF